VRENVDAAAVVGEGPAGDAVGRLSESLSVGGSAVDSVSTVVSILAGARDSGVEAVGTRAARPGTGKDAAVCIGAPAERTPFGGEGFEEDITRSSHRSFAATAAAFIVRFSDTLDVRESSDDLVGALVAWTACDCASDALNATIVRRKSTATGAPADLAVPDDSRLSMRPRQKQPTNTHQVYPHPL